MEDFTSRTKAFLKARDGSESTRAWLEAHAHEDVAEGLYVQWLRNESDYCAWNYGDMKQDKKKQPDKRKGSKAWKTLILPHGYSVKVGKFRSGFFKRRDTDYGNLVVTYPRDDDSDWPGVTRPAWSSWRKVNRRWLVYMECFREIFVSRGNYGREAELKKFVKKWLAQEGLLFDRSNCDQVVQHSNATTARERITKNDFTFTKNENLEWTNVRDFDANRFQRLVKAVEAGLGV